MDGGDVVGSGSAVGEGAGAGVAGGGPWSAARSDVGSDVGTDGVAVSLVPVSLVPVSLVGPCADPRAGGCLGVEGSSPPVVDDVTVGAGPGLAVRDRSCEPLSVRTATTRSSTAATAASISTG